MISYFQELDDEVYKLEIELKKLGWYFDNINDLVDLYQTFSEEIYHAGFMMVDEHYIKEFITWLQDSKHLTIHYVY